MRKNLISDNSLSTLIKESITEDIIIGKIRPGEKLIEAKYAEEFGTSRAPIREAFYLLTLDGFVQKIPRKGTVVKGFSLEEIRDLLEVRNFLEDLAVSKLHGKDPTSYVESVVPILEEMKEVPLGNEYAKLNYEFHYQLILASGSSVIKNMYSRLGTPLLSVQTMFFMENRHIKKSIEDHYAIVEHIREGRLVEAKQLLLAHNQAVFPMIEKHILKQKNT